MNNNDLPAESNNPNITMEHVNIGLAASVFGLLTLVFGAKPEWVGLDRSPVVGFVQITVVLIGLAIMCVGGTIGLGALWGKRQKSILADIGLRLVSTGYVIAVFSGMADVFGMTLQQNTKVPFFGPWQAAGLNLGLLIIAIGIIMLIPFEHITKKK
jgi:hypothetical protein